MVAVDKKHFHNIPDALFLSAQGGACFYCKRLFNRGRKPTKDHIYPRAGGHTLRLNKVFACQKCNQKKGSRLPTESEVKRARRLYAAMGVPCWEIP